MHQRQFSKRSLQPVLSRDESVRQGQAVRAASAAFRDTDAVRDFLNGFHSGLDARPLDLAVASAAGLKRVEQAIAFVSAARRNLQRSVEQERE
jgi:uncharacterized protein (DUF2384 family)